MKLTSGPLYDAIRTDYSLYAQPLLRAEWNWNRYTETIVVDNILPEDTDGFDIEMFPIESIIEANRPTKGIIKGLVGAAIIADKNDVQRDQQVRFYVSSVDDQYKYWTSPVPTNGSGDFPTHTDTFSVARPRVDYGIDRTTNKIVVKFENTWASPDAFKIRVKNTSDAWVDAIVNPTINNATGECIVYWDGTNWSSSQPSGIAPTTIIRGVEVMVDSLKGGYDKTGAPVSHVNNGVTTPTNGFNSYLNVIEISARYEVNLTDRLVNVNDTFDLGEADVLKPIGTISSNVATVTLSNVDRLFNGSDPTSPYYQILEPNVHMTLDYVYTVSGTDYTVREFDMYAGDWQGQVEDEVTIELRDFSKYMQETTPRKVFYQNLTVDEIVWRLCDSVGFSNYVIETGLSDTHFVVPNFYTDGEQTLWEVFNELAEGTQTAIYFDSYGKLQVKSREAVFNNSKTPTWTLRGEDAGAELADIENFDQNEVFEANQVTVAYQSTEFTEFNKGWPKLEQVWEPEGTVVLRAADLKRDLLIGGMTVWMPPAEARLWPYEGIMNIEGELVRYSGKRYAYYDNGVRTIVTIKSNDEKQKYDGMTTYVNRHKNGFTGALVVTERGLWNSEEKNHYVEASGYSVRNILNGVSNSNVAGFRHIKTDSVVQLSSGPRFKREDDLLIATRGQTSDTGFFHYGTRIKFSKGFAHNRAGIVFHNHSSNESGYYVELQPSNKFKTAKDRKKRHELYVYSRKSGTERKIATRPLAIVENTWYNIDVHLVTAGGRHRLDVWVNGRKVANSLVEVADENVINGKFGMFIRGKSRARFEYLYAYTKDRAPLDDASFLDRIEGGIMNGNQLDREWIWEWGTRRRRIRKKRWTKERIRKNGLFMDEFGPIIHEVREFDVAFDPNPVLHSRLYLSNEYQAICPEYQSDAFGARFILANSSRINAVVNGEDSISYAGTSDTIEQVFFVIGRALVRKEEEEVVARDEFAIRKRGPIEVQHTSPWIQSKRAAQALADWIVENWSSGVDTATVSIFGNPLIELTDVVAVEYADNSMTTATHKYFVTGTSTSFDTGMSTELTIRRVPV